MADILDNLFGGGDAPDYDAPKLSPGNEKFIVDQVDAGISPDKAAEIMKRRLAGMEGTNLLNPAAANDLDGKAMSEAIKQKSMKAYDTEINKMKTQAEIEGVIQANQGFNRSSRLMNQLVGANRAIDNRIRKAIENKQAARNQVLANVLGVAGMVAGAAVAGPAGASVGSSVGRSAAGKTSTGYMNESKPKASQRYSVLDQE